MGLKIHYAGAVGKKADETYIDAFAWTDPLVFVFSACAIFGALWLVCRHGKRMARLFVREKPYGLSKRIFFLVCAIAMVLCWLPYLLSFYPGSVQADSFFSLYQAEGITPWNNHHPILYALITGTFIRIGVTVFGSHEAGILLYSLFQSTVMIAVFSSIITFFYKRKARPWLIVISMAYYCFMPFFPAYGITLWKDPLFSIAVVAMGALLYKASQGNGSLDRRSVVMLLASAFFCIFLRNNGIYIVGLCAVWLLLLYRRHAVRLASCLVALVAASAIVTGPIYGMLGIQKAPVESYGVPMQQVARVVATDAASLTDYQKERLSRFLPLDAWGGSYRPALVDNLKWDPQFNMEYFNGHEKEFMTLWAELLPEHLGEYVDAYLLNTMGFWHPVLQDYYGYIALSVAQNSLGIELHDILESTIGLSLSSELSNPRFLLGSGTMALVAVFSLALCGAASRKKGISLFFLPSMGCWLTVLIAAPVAFCLRYVYPFAILLPVFVFLPAYLYSKGQNTSARESNQVDLGALQPE